LRGFDDHKQEVFDLVQVLKMLFLNNQNKKHGVKEYRRNFHSLWDTVEAFDRSPGIPATATSSLRAPVELLLTC
jgi:hypothetical protein